MDERENKNPKLRLIRGGAGSKLAIGGVQIFVGPEKMSPYPVDAVVEEEDTFLVLSADPEFVEPKENLIRVMTEAIESQPAQPGSVIVLDSYPYRFLAVIHDLNQEPSWKEEWVATALDEVFREAEERKIQSIALPLLGTLHGSFEKRRFITLLHQTLGRKSPSHLRRIWIVTPEGTASETLEILKADFTKSSR